MKAAWFRTALLAAALSAAPATAQLAPGVSGFSDAPRTASEEEYWFFVRELGQCLAQSKRTQSIALMATAVDSVDEGKVFRTLINRNGANSCMRNMVRATIVRAQVRGAIAEGLYKLSGVSTPPATPVSAPVAPGEVKSIHEFADCFVASNYAKARALLIDTRLGTTAENERVRALVPDFRPCLPERRQIRLVAMDVRLALAGALYRASAVRPQLAQGTN